MLFSRRKLPWRYYASRRQWRNYPGGTRFTRTRSTSGSGTRLLENVARAFETRGGRRCLEGRTAQKIGELDGARFFITRASIAMTPRRELVEPNAPLDALAVRAAWRGRPVLRTSSREQLIDASQLSEASAPHDDADTQSGGVGRQPQACAASHAVDGAREHLLFITLIRNPPR